jgi:hypothetical protein
MQAPKISVDKTKFCRLNIKLPPILLLQMDIYVGDKTNFYLHQGGCLTLLKLVFLCVGYTHEYIHGTYGRLSTKLK